MPFTGEERKVVEALVKKQTAMAKCLKVLKDKIIVLEDQIELMGDSDLADMAIEDIKSIIGDTVEDIIENMDAGKLPNHNHKSNLQGGDCFAKLGANLID